MPDLALARSSIATLAVGVALAAAAFGAWPAVTVNASGTFEARKGLLPIKGAYSFWGKSAAPGGKAVIKVAVSNPLLSG